MITVVNLSDEDLWDGAQVINLIGGQIKTIKVLPKDMTISEAVQKRIFNPVTDIDFKTFILNKHRFELVQ